MTRLVAVLNYYDSLMMNARDGDDCFWQNRFLEFGDKYYSQKWMLEEHVHCLESTNQKYEIRLVT